MSIAIVPNGSLIADYVLDSANNDSTRSSVPNTLGDLMVLLERNPPKSFPMLGTTASLIAAFFDSSFEETTIDRVNQMRGRFRRYLETRKYAENSVRSYVNYARMLTGLARQHGWRPNQTAPKEWQQVLALAPGKKCTDIARYLAQIKKTPSDVTIEDVESWAELRLEEGVSYNVVTAKKGLFWRLLRECGSNDNLPLSITKLTQYGIPFGQFPQPLRTQVEGLLKWKTAEFSLDRPKKGQIRQVTADKIREKVCQLLGFAVNIRGASEVNSLTQLVTKEIVSDYVAWCINERGVKGETLHNHLGRLDVAMRQHPSYASLSLSWFKTLLESLPIEPESERRMRKVKKYLDYPIIEAIPAMIRAERSSSSKHRTEHVEALAMEELLIRWLIILANRQRNIRQCRVGGPAPNLFKAKIPSYTSIDKPIWVQMEEQRNPEAQFWQLHFTAKETKTGKEIHAVLPRPLIAPLEEYLAEFRPQLVKQGDPGTLFIGNEGRPLTSNSLCNLVSRLTSRYGGRRVNPHLFRDIVAFAWLKEHPRDFLTLSKILWHANIQTTIRTYGSRFDESSGMCAMEAWVEEREAKSK